MRAAGEERRLTRAKGAFAAAIAQEGITESQEQVLGDRRNSEDDRCAVNVYCSAVLVILLAYLVGDRGARRHFIERRRARAKAAVEGWGRPLKLRDNTHLSRHLVWRALQSRDDAAGVLQACPLFSNILVPFAKRTRASPTLNLDLGRSEFHSGRGTEAQL
jgi:hypothetical protein